METLLDIHNLIVKAEKATILDLPDLSIYRDEVLVVLGPNGAGKSTLLLVAAGLKKPTCGSIQFTQTPHLSDLEYRRKISTVFQSPLLLTGNVENNIASGLKFRGTPKSEIQKRVNNWMEMLHISHLAKRRANTLSGGEAQRVSLARAFCLQTELILMDEPFSALDKPTRQELLDELRNILSKTNQTCIYVTHDLEEALTIGDRVAVLFNGKLHQLSKTQDVFDHPATPEVAAFMGVENIIPGKIVSRNQDLFQIQAGNVMIEIAGDYSIGSRVYVCLRPEDITLFPIDDENQLSTARNHLKCQITHLSNQGSFIRVQLEAGFKLTALVTRPSARELHLEAGMQMIAGFKTTAIHLIPTGKFEN
jgi:tungstate transport system ATP-binding protein